MLLLLLNLVLVVSTFLLISLLQRNISVRLFTFQLESLVWQIAIADHLLLLLVLIVDLLLFLILNLLLSKQDISRDASFRIHILYLPLSFQMHLSLLMAIVLFMLLALKEIILAKHHLLIAIENWRVDFSDLWLTCMVHSLDLLLASQIFVYALLGQFIITLLVFTLIARIKEQMVSLLV